MRLLLVEDEKKVSDLVARALRAERYAVDVAEDGQRGWELAQSYDYDLIILDLMLPQLSGEELLRRIRRGNPQVPILILTARGATEEKVQNFEAGADDYLTKPFAFAELVMRVKALLRRGPIARSSVLRVADLEVDRFTQQVRRGGRRIELTPKEYSLLEYLAANPGRVCLAYHDHRARVGPELRRSHQHRRRVRASSAGKVDDPFPVKLIRTVRGVGYGLSETLEL